MNQPTMRTMTYLAFALLLAAPLALGAATADVLERDLTIIYAPLEVVGDLHIDGTLTAAPGTDLIVRATGDITLAGIVRGAHGAYGRDGGAVLLSAGGTLRVLEGARVESGAGGHGAPAYAPGGVAYGGAGGAGGAIRLFGETVDVAGLLATGNGGRGGDAYGAEAYGGDAGAVGAAFVNGARAEVNDLVENTESPMTFEEFELAMTHCLPTQIGNDAPPLSAMPGGNACAHGVNGVQGPRGEDGQDDADFKDKNLHCPNYLPGYQIVDGEQGQRGFNGVSGTVGLAVGGRGGDAPSSGIQAGNGGTATATGGTGGRGGDGGWGGHAGTKGNGCRGGDGGTGGSGGNGLATGGLQGINAFNCSKNGNSGAANAYGGGAGAGGWGAGGGGGNWPWSNGAHGSNGYGGSAGTPVPTVPPTLPCFAPDAPTVAVTNTLSCTSLALRITQPVFTGNSIIASYKIYRSTTPGNEVYTRTVSYTGPLTIVSEPGLVENQTYYYKVKAVTPVGESPLSDEASGTPRCIVNLEGDVLQVIDTGGVLPAPTLTAATGVLPGTIVLGVLPAPTVAGVTHYNLYRGLVSGATSYVGTIPYTGIVGETYIDTGLAAGTTYFYNVTAVNGAGQTPSSNEAFATTFVLFQIPGGLVRVSEASGSRDGEVTQRACDGVPLSLVFQMDQNSFTLQQTYGASRNVAAIKPGAVPDTWCTTGPAQESRTLTDDRYYGEQGNAPPSCLDTESPDTLVVKEGRYVITNVCKSGRDSMTMQTVLAPSAEGGWDFTQDFYMQSGGEWRAWHADGHLDIVKQSGVESLIER